MEFVTVGQNKHPGFKMQLCYDPNYDLSNILNVNDRFRLILVEEGSGILRLNNRRLLFNAPVLFCVSELEVPALEDGSNIKSRAIYFHPGAVNSRLDFDILRNPEGVLSPTDRNDCTALRPFFMRDEKYYGQLTIGPATARRISQFFDSLGMELSDQRDEFWPCRSRSFFLELIFVLERVYFNPEMTEELPVLDECDDIDKVILHLHTNYQQKLTLEDLTRTFHVNRNTLRERFIELTGMPVMAYLINLRLRIASLMLKDTMIPVSEILNRVGFNDSTHFGRAFKKYYGCSPSEYREQYCWLLN